MSNQLSFNYTDTRSSLDYTMTFPESLFISPQTSFYDKTRLVPSTCLDKLHPEKTDAQPYAEYVDHGLWKSRIVLQKDSSYSIWLSKLQAAKNDREGKTYESLDTLCEEEVKRRFPNYQKIDGFKAALKNSFPTFSRIVMGSEGFYQQLTQKEIDKYKKQVAYSAINRDDLICSPKIEDPTLRQQLQLTDDTKLQSEHLFAKNSPLNGQSFLLKGRAVHLSQAIACSNDRKVENTGNLRVVQSKDKQSICYTGRADSERKALEQASFIFLNELKTKGKGITTSVDSQGSVIYQLDYVANSMLSIPWIWGTESPIAPFPEREYLENERKAFIALKEKGTLTIEDPNLPGMKYQVKFNPILFTRSSNIFTRLEKWLPPFFTGRSRAQEISEEGFSTLKVMATQKLLTLQEQLQRSPANSSIEEKIQRITTCLATLEHNIHSDNLRPEEEWITRDYLCKLLDLPCIYHCKSSTDRASVTVALSSSLRQWIDLNLPIPEKVADLITDLHFKELFAANWMTGHQMTRYARGSKGTVAGEKFNNKNLGLHLSRGIVQNPLIAHLLPERYLTSYPLANKWKSSIAYLCLILPLTLLIYLPLICATAARHLAYLVTGGKNRHWIGPAKFTLPLLPFTLLFNFWSIFPDKVLNEDSPQVGQRQLNAGGKNGGKDDNDR